MSRIKKAFKFQIDNKFNLFKSHNLKAVLANVVLRLLIFTVIVFGIYMAFSRMFTMLGLQVNTSFLTLALVGCQAISFVFGIANIITTLYLSKDNELLMVLPITFNEIFVSKILVLYVLFNNVAVDAHFADFSHCTGVCFKHSRNACRTVFEKAFVAFGYRAS